MISAGPPFAVDYLLIGHVSLDERSRGGSGTDARFDGSVSNLGGTVAYSALTARALGRTPALLTSCAADLDLGPLGEIPSLRLESSRTTTFRNRQEAGRRTQHLLARAADIENDAIPVDWRSAAIIHLAPIAGELDPSIIRTLPAGALLGITPQGWMRGWSSDGRVRFSDWGHARAAFEAAGAVVVSLEDLDNSEHEVEALAAACPLLAVTEGQSGARVYWRGDVRRFPAPSADQIDPTGAGDIFAAAFFVRLEQTQDPWEAARFANILASRSVTRTGIAGVPTPEEARQASMVWTP